MGTEFGLPCVAPMPVNKVLEWIPNMAEDGPFVEGQAIDEQDEWDVQVPGAAPEPVEIGLHGALRVPTLMHVVSNASNDMLVGAEVLQESVEQLSAVAKLMDSKHSRARLKAIHVSVVLFWFVRFAFAVLAYVVSKHVIKHGSVIRFVIECIQAEK